MTAEYLLLENNPDLMVEIMTDMILAINHRWTSQSWRRRGKITPSQLVTILFFHCGRYHFHHHHFLPGFGVPYKTKFFFETEAVWSSSSYLLYSEVQIQAIGLVCLPTEIEGAVVRRCYARNSNSDKSRYKRSFYFVFTLWHCSRVLLSSPSVI